MNPPRTPAAASRAGIRSARPTRQSPRLTHTLFRLLFVAVLGSFFVFQLDVGYLWLTALLTVAGIVLGILLLIRAVKHKESRLVLFGTIVRDGGLRGDAAGHPGLRLFFNQIRDYQQCVRHALTLAGHVGVPDAAAKLHARAAALVQPLR